MHSSLRAAINSRRSYECGVCLQILRVSESVSKEVVFVADVPMTMKGIQFEVPEDTAMLFGAPGFSFEKGKVRAGNQAASISRPRTPRLCLLEAGLLLL